MANAEQSPDEQAAHAKARRINRTSTWGAIILAVGLAAVSFFLMRNASPPYNLDQVHKNEKLRDTVTLMSFQIMPDGAMKELSAPPHVGDIVGFKIASARPVHITLAVSVNGQPPNILSEDARIPPGPARRLEKQDKLLSYTVEDKDKTLRFCVVGSDDFERLARRTAILSTSWDTLPATNCQQVK